MHLAIQSHSSDYFNTSVSPLHEYTQFPIFLSIPKIMPKPALSERTHRIISILVLIDAIDITHKYVEYLWLHLMMN